MWINDELKYIHIAIPRTASTQVSMLLGNLKHPEPDEHHMGLKEVLNKYPDKKDYFKFTFVRHPLDRLVSLYFEFTKNRVHKYSGNITKDQPLFSEFNVGTERENFNNFCLNFPRSGWATNIFLRPQAHFVDAEVPMNFIGRFERLEQDWWLLTEKIFPKPISLIDMKNNTRQFEQKPRSSNHIHYTEYYDKESIDVVKDFYARDFEIFGYN